MSTSDKLHTEIFCPVCASIITDEEKPKKCEYCSTLHHSDCWKYAGGCAIFGCKKGVIGDSPDRNQCSGNLADVNLYLIQTWSWLFHIHWLAFVITGYGLTILTCIALLYQFVYTVFDLLVSSGATEKLYTIGAYSIMWKFCNFILFGYFNVIFLIIPVALIFFGAAAYMALLPAAIIMRIHFHSIHRSLPEWHSQEARAIAERVDMHQSVHYVKALNKIFIKIIEYFLGGSILVGVMALLAGTSHIIPFVIAVAILLLMRLVLLPFFNTALQGRVTLLLTFQNRLIATANHETRWQSE